MENLAKGVVGLTKNRLTFYTCNKFCDKVWFNRKMLRKQFKITEF